MRISKFHKVLLNSLRFFIAELLYDNSPANQSGEFNFKDIRNIVVNKADGKLGDTQVISFLIDSIKKHYPEINITVLCSGTAKEIYQDIYKVNTIQISKRPSFSEIRTISAQILKIGSCDLLLSTEEMCRPRDIYLAHCLKPNVFAGFDKRLKCINLNLFKRNHGKHITSYFADLLNLGSIKCDSIEYKKLYGDNDLEWVKSFYQGRKTIGIAPCGASKSRHLQIKVIKELCRFIEKNTDYYIVPFLQHKDIETRAAVIPSIKADRAIFLPQMNVAQFAAATGALDALISVDTANIHIAAASKVPTFGIYNGFGQETPRWFPGPAAHPLSEHFQCQEVEIKDLSFKDLSYNLSSFLEKLK